ncbi:MAG: hypothetical protein K2M44_06225 [Clostridia bacterium]|nr:hypothetical protein [Clostridia bacterium]
MKTKLMAVIILVVMVCAILISCDLITTDEKKDYHQVVAEVNYDGLKDIVYKGELRNLYNAYGYIYTNESYYGMSEEEALEYFYDSLTRQKLILLKAEVELAKSMGIDYKSADFKITSLLTQEEIRYCVLRANSEYKTQWNNRITTLEDEQNANVDDDEEDDDDEEEEEELEPRNVRSEDSPSTDFEEGRFTGEGTPEYFATWYDKEIASKQSEINDLKKQVKQAQDEGKDVTELNAKLDKAKSELKNMKSAYSYLQEVLESNYTDFEKTLQTQYENRVRAKYEDLCGESVTLSESDYETRIKNIIKINVDDYKTASAYETAFNGNKTIVKHNFKGYFNVRSILFKFTDEQTAYVKALTDMAGGDEDVSIVLREFLALGVADGDVTGLLKNIVDRFGSEGNYGGLKVNVSNPDYDSEDDDSVAYTDKDIAYTDVLAAMLKYFKDKKAEFMAEATRVKGEQFVADNTAVLERYAIDEAFTDLIYMVNDDTGMFSSDFYTVSPDKQDTSYVEEYAVLARRLYKETDSSVRADIGTMSVSDKGSVIASGTTSNTQLESKHLIGAAGKSYSLYKSVKKSETTKDEMEANVYTFETEDGSISFIINTYGIQMIMIDGYAFDETQIGNTVIEEDGTYTLTDDYIFDSRVEITYEIDDDFTYKKDADDNRIIKDIKVVSDTLKQSMTKTLLDNKKSDEYNYMITNFLSDNASSITQKTKVYNKLKKDLIK